MVTRNAMEGSVFGPVPALLFFWVGLMHYSIHGVLLFIDKFMAYLWDYCNCSSASLDSVLVPLRGMRELWQSVCGLGRNSSFLDDDQGDAC